MANIDLSQRDHRIASPVARVWVREKWSDQWTPRPDLEPVQATDAVSPTLSVATLRYRYGWVTVPGTNEPQRLDRITSAGWYVLIHWNGDDESRSWLGAAGHPVTEVKAYARNGDPETGDQTIPCHGLRRALELTRVRSTVFDDGAGETAVADTAAVFNQSAMQRNSDPPVFSPHPLDHDDSVPWSSRAIVQYLFEHFAPYSETSNFGFAATGWDVIPSWDQPDLVADNRTVAELLDELLPQSRGLGWRVTNQVTIDGNNAITAAPMIEFFSRYPAAIDLGPAGQFAGAAINHHMTIGDDPLTNPVVDDARSQSTDQVIVEGPREIGIMTIRLADLEQGWTSEDQAAYQSGASDEDGYDDLKPYQQRAANERVRRLYPDVFTRYRLPPDWDGTNQDGQPGFWPDPDSDDPVNPFVPMSTIMADVPLSDAIDYAADEPGIADELAGHYPEAARPADIWIEEPPIFNVPAEPPYLSINDAGQLSAGINPAAADIDFTVTFEFDGHEIRLNFDGAPNHALIKDFAGVDVDPEQRIYGTLDHSTIIMTVAIEGPRRARWSIPADNDLSGRDFPSRKIIRVDDIRARLVYLSAGTVTKLRLFEGSAETAAAAVLVDPLARLRAIAELAAESSVRPRYRVTLDTGRLIPEIEPGHLIRSVDDQDVGASVAEIKTDFRGGRVATTIVATPDRFDIDAYLRGV